MSSRNMNLKQVVAVAALVLLAALPVDAAPVSGALRGKVRWQGEVVLGGPVVIERGATLSIAAGTGIKPLKPEFGITVHGILVVEGSATAPVRVVPTKGWRGIEFFEGGPESRIAYLTVEKAEAAISSIATHFTVQHATFRDCGTGIKLVRESSPRIDDCNFERNETGVENQMKSGAMIRRSRFSGHTKTAILSSHNSVGTIEGCTFEKNKQAIGLIQKYPDRIAGNRFVDNEIGIYCNQTQNTPVISGNTFERNKNAVVNFSFSYPVVEQNTFTGNETAVRNDQYGSPRVGNNLFRGNKTALYNYRKSNPVVEKNIIENGDLALYCDYSSYPVVKNNNITGNKMGVELGIYQSADWEKRSGSKTIMQEQAAARQSQNPLLAQAPTEFKDYVDVSGNWWGGDTAQLAAAKGGNVKIFFDRKDKPKVTYEGFGTGSYALDEVRYTPWLTAPVKEAGPTTGKSR